MKLQRLIRINTEEQTRLEAIEKYLIKNYIIISNSFDDYVNKKLLKKRIFFGLMLNIFYWIAFIRYFLVAIVDEPWIWIIFGDVFYLTGQPRLVNYMFCTATVSIAFFGKKYNSFVIGSCLFSAHAKISDF